MKLAGVTTDNPFLPVLRGVDLSLAMPAVNIDFGGASVDGWNSVNVTSHAYMSATTPFGVPELQAIDVNGDISRLFVSTSDDFFSSQNNNDSAVNAEDRDYIFVAVSNGSGVGSTVGYVYLDNLNPGTSYRIELLARRDGSSSNCIADYEIGGSPQTIDASDNTVTNIWDAVYPDSDGRITLTIDKNGRNGFAYLNWIKIQEM
jgi:hypothetical protein